MSPSDPPQAATSASKKKNNKKKKNAAKAKPNGDVVANAVAADKAEPHESQEHGQDEAVDDSEQSTVNTPIEKEHPKTPTAETNGHAATNTSTNGQLADVPEELPVSSTAPAAAAPADDSDTTKRLEAMSQDREALRAEVEQLRKSLEDIQEKHAEETSAIRAELEESQAAKEQAQSQYQNLLGRVNTIKSTLGERLAADRQELAEAREQIDELEGQNETLRSTVESLETQISAIKTDAGDSNKELSELRNRHNLAQHNWTREREDLEQQLKHIREEAEAAKEAMGDWEVLAREERRVREGVSSRLAELEEELANYKSMYERADEERESQSHTIDGLQKALHDIQEARKRELRDMVETSQEQLEAANNRVQQAETRASEAEASKKALEAELERMAPFEKEVKEKNLLIGKLRHEAIVLNDHLTKALRLLKKTKPEDNIDRQIVTNHFLHFITLDRSDPKKFQVLQLIAALLNWTDEEREQAGLARPGASSNSLRPPVSPFHRTPSTPSLSTDFFPDSANSVSKESLAELWTGFLERQAEEARPGKTGSGSISSASGKPDARG